MRKGLNIGASLLGKVEERARKEGKRFITLTAGSLPEEGGEHPYQFYRKLGYQLAASEDARRIAGKLRGNENIYLIKFIHPAGKAAYQKMAREERKAGRTIIIRL